MTPRVHSDVDRVSGLLLGLACGAVIGAALGLLFAPTSGPRARAWVAEQGRTAGRRVAERLSRQEATDIVRRKGVRGLLAVLRGGRATATG